MLAVPAVLLALALAVALIPSMVPGFERAAALFTDHGGYAQWVLRATAVPLPQLPPSHISGDDVLYGVLSVLGAPGAAARTGARHDPRPAAPSLRPHRRLHRLVDGRRRRPGGRVPARALSW